MFDHRLLHVEIWLLLNDPFQPELVSLLVALGPWCPNGWTFLCVEHSKLNASLVGIYAHFAAESVDFPSQVAFRKTANCWVARHLPDRVEIGS